MPANRFLCCSLVSTLLWSLASQAAFAEAPPTGPETEQRFPPLVVPAGFKATLFACDPLIEYPSVIAAGPRPGAVFVAIDYMTGLGTEIVRRSEVRLVQDTDGDGYADIAPIFADGFNSIMGIAWHDNTLFVMNAPHLTALRDVDGDGKADERKDLLTGLGLTPEENPVRLHCANGVTAGHDGWLYLALGDHGCDVQRPEGDRLVFHGGGILRCRQDGRGLHVFASGLRNIYDVALDAELNVFVRDNENDGGDYKIRVCHSFFGADHGYPYLYYERPEEALPPLADLGLGSSAGGVCYLETQFPAEYRGNLFFCEWGKSLIRYQPQRADGSSFAPLKEIEFATSPANDPYGLKPTDVVVQRDGTLMVSDWCDGQRPKRGRGRIYCISHGGKPSGESQPATAANLRPDQLCTLLDNDSYAARCEAQSALEQSGQAGLTATSEALKSNRLGVRGRLHAVWILAKLQRADAILRLLDLLAADAESGVRVQAIRAVADLADPELSCPSLPGGAVGDEAALPQRRGDAELAARLAAFGKQTDRRVQLEVIVALGRLKWSGTADWLAENLKQPDAAAAHAAQQALRRSSNWPAVLKLLDLPISDPLRAIALRAAAKQFDPDLVAGLIERLQSDGDAARRQQYADLLTCVHRKPGPWVYWNYRPLPRPANPEGWEQTDAIAAALDDTLGKFDPAARLTLLKCMQREKILVRLETLEWWLQQEPDANSVEVLLASIAELPASEVRQLVVNIILRSESGSENRLAALRLLEAGLDEASAECLLMLASTVEEELLLAATLRLIGKYPKIQSDAILSFHLSSAKPKVRAAAIEALASARPESDRDHLPLLLADSSAEVRRAATEAAGLLKATEVLDLLLMGALDSDAGVRRSSLESLRTLKEQRAVPLAAAALGDRQTEAAALRLLAELGGPEQAGPVADLAKRSPSADTLVAAVKVLTTWNQHESTSAEQRHELDHLVNEIHGTSGSLVRWRVRGPLTPKAAAAALETITASPEPAHGIEWQMQYAAGTESRVSLPAEGAANDSHWLACADVTVPEPTDIELLASNSGSLRIWLNDQLVHQRDATGGFRIDSDRASAALVKGDNRVLLEIASSVLPPEFHLRFRRKSATVEHERLAAAALTRAGNIERGRQVLLNVEKSLCLKCHRLGEQGERTGPELTGIGSRFSRIHIVESILEPGRTIAPSFGTLAVLLNDGTTVAGVKIAETETTLTLVDRDAQKRELGKRDIDQQRASPLSTMPDGLEKRLNEEEFVDLAAFLASLQEKAGP